MVPITGWILRHRLLVAACWIIIAVVGLASTSSATGALSQQFAPAAGYEGMDTNAAILHTYGAASSLNPFVAVVTLPRGTTVATPGVTRHLAAAFGAAGAALPGSRVASYASTGDRAFVSSDGRTTFALVYLSVQPGAQAVSASERIITRALAAHPIAGAHSYVTGRDVLAAASVANGGGPSVLTETLIGGLGALLILIFVFGSSPPRRPRLASPWPSPPRLGWGRARRRPRSNSRPTACSFPAGAGILST